MDQQNQVLYDMFAKRKSFHVFRNVGQQRLTAQELVEMEEAFAGFMALYPEIPVKIRIVPTTETSRKTGGEYCVMFYSEKQDGYMENIGYLGEQLDLYLVSRNIGTLWYGLGKTKEQSYEGLDFVIMMVIAKVENTELFRKDMYKAKRKAVEEIWEGEPLRGVTDLVRFAPSACNSQPWVVTREGKQLTVYRFRKRGMVGILPAAFVSVYNRIDIGIFLCFLDLCLEHEEISYSVNRFPDLGTDDLRTRVAVYQLENI